MLVKVSRQALWITIVAALCQGVYAADGVTLIDQRAAARGNVTNMDTPGFPVTISEAGS
jgi:hypothetical protein